MCGIAGVARRDGAPLGDPAALAEALGGALAHRGPDGSGAWTSPASDVLLVHRRLAVIDVSDGGAQPMMADGRHLIVFNGEIYNYRDLRAELEQAGHTFRTASDTEVLLRLLMTRGAGALARVRGMFALAWWDSGTRSLLLARDRFGIKPLYVAAAPGSIAFASELRALRAGRLIDDRPSTAAVLAFLAWGSVPPPLAWNEGAEVLEPGGWFEWRQDGGERRGTFADARGPYAVQRARPSDPRELVERTSHAVRESVRAHLVADVPVGVFLSGGIDSGAIVSAATSAGTTGLQTFTVAFDDETSEAARARTVADAFGTKHHELRLAGQEVAGDLPQILARIDQPTIDAINTFYVSRAVAATGIKAVLSGTGGDELFGGYPSFSRLPRAMRAKRIVGPFWPIVAGAGRIAVPSRLQARWRHFAAANGSLVEAYRVQRAFLLPEELEAIAGPALRDSPAFDSAAAFLEEVEHARLDPAGPEGAAASVARMESRLYLQSQLLRDTDVMSMAHGLEVRLPFVDHEIVSAVWPDLGSHARLLAGKALLTRSLERPLPSAVVRHPKQGFTLPFARWMRGPLAPAVQDGLRGLAAAGWLAADAPARVWADWVAGRSHWSRPWGLGVLGHFLKSA
jgi:asparagine synthase (glutamine-hydrolysing)